MNPERDQDRVEDCFELFRQSGQVMFHQQLSIYKQLRSILENRYVLEAGCGIGIGTAVLERATSHIVGTDKLPRNIAFARAMYPWIEFGVWDINEPTVHKSEVVVCVEAFEHVQRPERAMQNLLNAAHSEAWISTPNGRGKPPTPENPFHVREYPPAEILDFVGSRFTTTIYDWKTWEVVDVTTDVDPLVYQCKRR